MGNLYTLGFNYELKRLKKKNLEQLLRKKQPLCVTSNPTLTSVNLYKHC